MTLPPYLDTAPIIAPALFEPLTSLQTAAIDLYRRGLNIFPVPRLEEVQAYAATRPGYDPFHEKPPYLIKPFFTSRLHLCGAECWKDGRVCLPEAARFENLFFHANLAVMLGRTSGNLIHIDCDTQKSYELVGNEFDKRGLPCWAFTSHRGGGYLVRLVEGEAANTRSLIPDVEIWGRLHFCVLPPSIHPLGTVYQWKRHTDPHFHLPLGEPPPLVNLESLGWLGVIPAVKRRGKWEEPELHNLPPWTLVLSRANRDFLAKGTTQGSRNYWLTRAAYDMAGNEIPQEDAECVLLDAARKCDPPYPNAQAILKNAYKSKRHAARAHDEHAPKPWQLAYSFALSYDWRVYGRMAQTARSAFLACVERARLDDSPTFRASLRELTELANFAKPDRAQRTMRLLMQPPALVKRVGKSEFTGANLYAFTGSVLVEYDKPRAPNRDINLQLQCVASPSGARENTIINAPPVIPTTLAEKDVFSRLGPVAWRVWSHLCMKSEPTAAAIARAEKLNAGSVRKALKRLANHGLVTFGTSEMLYYGEAKTEEELERLSATLYTLGKSAKRKRRHQTERERRLNDRLARERERWRVRYLAWRKEEEKNNA